MSRAHKICLTAGGMFCLVCSSSLETINALKQQQAAQLQSLEKRILELEERLERHEKQQQEKTAVLNQELHTIRDSLVQVRNGLEQKADTLRKQDLNLDSQIALLTDEIREFEERVLKGDRAEAGAREARTSLDIRALYNKGMRYYNNGKYRQAIETFSQINSPGLNSDLADNAQYWISESHYYLKEYQEALEGYQKVFAFKKSNKDDDALIRMGYTYLKLDDKVKALDTFKKFVDDFPYSEYIKDAQKKCTELERQLERNE